MKIAATHKYMDVRHQFEVDSLEEARELNGEWWKDFEVVQ